MEIKCLYMTLGVDTSCVQNGFLYWFMILTDCNYYVCIHLYNYYACINH